jgi:hypothetical protein
MKINYDRYPILKMIEDKSIGEYSHFSCDRDYFLLNPNRHFIRSKFDTLSKKLEPNKIFYLSQPFIDAYESAGDNIFKSKLYHEVEDTTALFLHPGGEQNLISIKNDLNEKVIIVSTISFIKDHTLSIIGECFYNYSDNNSNPERDFFGWISNNIQNGEGNVFNLVLMTLFIKYAEIETKILGAKSKDNTIGCQYNNNTKSKILHLDSKWFTTLVKSDAFKVRGHFRLQPYGEGLKQRKLIWINDFEKSGYTAPARKLKEQ